MCVWVRGGRGVRSRWLREVFGVGRRKPEGTKREGNKNCYPSARSLPFPLTLLSSSFSFVVPSTEEEEEEDEEEEEELKKSIPAFAEIDRTAISRAASELSPPPSLLPPSAALHFFRSRA